MYALVPEVFGEVPIGCPRFLVLLHKPGEFLKGLKDALVRYPVDMIGAVGLCAFLDLLAKGFQFFRNVNTTLNDASMLAIEVADMIYEQSAWQGFAFGYLCTVVESLLPFLHPKAFKRKKTYSRMDCSLSDLPTMMHPTVFLTNRGENTVLGSVLPAMSQSCTRILTPRTFIIFRTKSIMAPCCLPRFLVKVVGMAS
jgi:hypothetical protein